MSGQQPPIKVSTAQTEEEKVLRLTAKPKARLR